jgi:hypothetical protein
LEGVEPVDSARDSKTTVLDGEESGGRRLRRLTVEETSEQAKKLGEGHICVGLSPQDLVKELQLICHANRPFPGIRSVGSDCSAREIIT